MTRWMGNSLRTVGLALLCLLPAAAKADEWALPADSTYQSQNGQFQFVVAVGSLSVSPPKEPSGTLRRKSGAQWEGVWTNQLVNGISPVQAMVHDSGRYVVTFDEYHSVGQNPVVIYGEHGRLIAHLSLADLKLENHPKITRSVSSYWWNEYAVLLFGPSPMTGNKPWRRNLEDSLFIRLFWGEVVDIDLASGKVRDDAWWKGLAPEHATAMMRAKNDYLNATWLRLARDYMRKENFNPNPKYAGIQGILLAGQLRLRESLPLLREIAATDRLQHWAAPMWKTGRDANVRALARAAIAEIQ